MEKPLKSKLDSFKEEFPKLFQSPTAADFDWLPAFYMRAAYFKDSFSLKIARGALCDGACDGGLDAVFANPNRGENEVVIVQSKCYKNAIRDEGLKNELRKIKNTLTQLASGRRKGLAERVKEAYFSAEAECEDPDEVCYTIDVVTSWVPSNDRQRESLKEVASDYRKAMKNLNVRDIRLVFGDELLELASSWDQVRPLVECDDFRWYSKDGVLRYDDSIMINLCASSLRDVYYARQKDVLGLNVRYHVRRNCLQREVDNGMEKTICNKPEDFWYLNNGIMIVCRDVKLNERKGTLRLFDYSIVNGGQTTYNINEHWASRGKEDFAVACKIVKVPEIKKVSGTKWAQAVAISANSQKPIKKAALVANNYEQVELGKCLEDLGVFYIRKDGDKPLQAKGFAFKPSIEDIGKLGLCGILLMPMEARGKLSTMFEAPYYDMIFNKRHAELFRDLLGIWKRYDEFRKNVTRRRRRPNWCEDEDEWAVASNGQTFVISSLMLCVRARKGFMSLMKIKRAAKETKERAKLCGNLQGMSRIFDDGPESAESITDECFRKFVHLIYEAWHDYMRKTDIYINVSAFLKRGEVFMEYVVPRLRQQKDKIEIDRILDSLDL